MVAERLGVIALGILELTACGLERDQNGGGAFMDLLAAVDADTSERRRCHVQGGKTIFLFEVAGQQVRSVTMSPDGSSLEDDRHKKAFGMRGRRQESRA